MHFASSGNRKPGEDGRRKCESSTFAIASRHSREKTFTFGALRHKRFRLLTFPSSFCPIPARDSKSPSCLEVLLGHSLLENSPAICPLDVGFKSGFRLPSSEPHPFTLLSRNTCKTLFSFKDGQMAFDTRSSSMKSGWTTGQLKTKRLRTRFPLPRTSRQPAMTGTLKSSGTRWIVPRSAAMCFTAHLMARLLG